MEAPMLLFYESWNMPLALLHCVFIDSQMFHSACNKLPIEQKVPQHGRKRLTLMNNVVKWLLVCSKWTLVCGAAFSPDQTSDGSVQIKCYGWRSYLSWQQEMFESLAEPSKQRHGWVDPFQYDCSRQSVLPQWNTSVGRGIFSGTATCSCAWAVEWSSMAGSPQI